MRHLEDADKITDRIRTCGIQLDPSQDLMIESIIDHSRQQVALRGEMVMKTGMAYTDTLSEVAHSKPADPVLSDDRQRAAQDRLAPTGWLRALAW